MSDTSKKRLSTGIKGLDEILMGGFIPQRAYLVRGGPGTGKTTLGLHFLKAGVANNERVLFISLEENEQSIRANASKIGIDISGIEFLDISPTPDYFTKVQSYDIFSPAEVEREPITNEIIKTIERIKPTRVLIDPITQFRYLSSDVFHFRKQILSFLNFLKSNGCTVVFTSENFTNLSDSDLQFIADGIIELEFGEYGRNMMITKFRGSEFLGKSHSMKIIRQHGITVFPRLVPEDYSVEFKHDKVISGVKELDNILHGGIERGTVTFISGPSGVGKTTVGCHFIREGAKAGLRSVFYSFDEEIEITKRRCESIGIWSKDVINQDTLLIEKIEPLKYTGDEFAQKVRHEVENKGAKIVMIDSIAGYRLSIEGKDISSHLHALVKYLQRMGVVVLLSVETHNLTGEFRLTDYEISYLADNIIFLRYIEVDGMMSKAIGVLKKRLSDFEKGLYEFQITNKGIRIGKPLSNLKGILTGTPLSP
ncbi:MAG: hypothetical protein N3A62_01105 [Thermodesulfovibrionales bacterium]|nr:hypothetical protein [Thermodesulfovibrionales bacterium]